MSAVLRLNILTVFHSCLWAVLLCLCLSQKVSSIGDNIVSGVSITITGRNMRAHHANVKQKLKTATAATATSVANRGCVDSDGNNDGNGNVSVGRANEQASERASANEWQCKRRRRSQTQTEPVQREPRVAVVVVTAAIPDAACTPRSLSALSQQLPCSPPRSLPLPLPLHAALSLRPLSAVVLLRPTPSHWSCTNRMRAHSHTRTHTH